MKVSLNTIKQYTAIDLSVDELVRRINERLGKVEEVIDLGKRYEGAVIAKVVGCKKHENADKLSVCEIDAGTGENVQVVCGAPNVREGIYVVWLPPGVTVPSSFSDKEPFVLEARELRGVVSNGMLASAKELGLGDSHDGILEIDPDEWKPGDIKIKPGTDFAKAYCLDDTIIDIENKMFTHRPDLFGQLGVAREIAGIQGNAFTSPDWYKDLPTFKSGDGLDFTVKNDASGDVPRFMAVAIKNITVAPSPIWLQAALVRLGGKPINNIVDATNYVMLLTAQPTHAYDYDKLRGQTLATRMAKKGESLTLLNGKTYKLDENDIVITDGEGPVGLGGIMGGGNSEVSSTTKNIVLECANFDMYTVRRSSMRHGLFTDALTRFNKGQSPLQIDYVLSLLMSSVSDVAGGEMAGQVYDMRGEMPVKAHSPVTVSPSFINNRLGLSLSAREITKILTNVEFHVAGTKTKQPALKVDVPFWRTDIQLPEDIVEEVGRLYGFDKLPRELPVRSTTPAPRNVKRNLKQRVRESLNRAGANEVLTYSFVHKKVMQHAEQSVEEAFELSNALSPELQYYRLSVLPSLLDKVHMNIKAGHSEFALFELGKGHNKKHHLRDSDGLPAEMEFIDLVYTSKKPQAGAAYYRARRLVVQLASDLGITDLVMKPIDATLDFPVTAPFDLTRSALIETSSGTFIGMVGELKSSVLRSFKLPQYTVAATLDTIGLVTATQQNSAAYRALPRFPKVSQDISLRVAADIPYVTLRRIVSETLSTSEISKSGVCILEPYSIYQPEKSDSKTVTFHIEVASYERTLTDKDVSVLLDTVADRAHKDLNAQRI